MVERGEIHSEQAYAQGKMLDHSSWVKGKWKMPRKITPSDVDMAIDNDGKILYCELSSGNNEWRQLDWGQIKLYRNCIYGSAGLAVLCKHDVPITRKIDTRNDIVGFQVMSYSSGNKYEPGFNVTPVYKGIRWEPFVKSWFDDPAKVRIKCLEDIA